MRRVKIKVPREEAIRRVLEWGKGRGLFHTNEPANIIWPEAEFRAQGAAAAAGRVLAEMKKRGLVVWERTANNWGWRVL